MTKLNELKVTHADDVERFYWEPLFGPGPYTYEGYEFCTYQACHGAPVQVGTCCDVCGQGIKNVAHWSTPDGKRFKTGLDCAAKSGRKEVIGKLRLAKREQARKQRERLAAKKLAELNELLETGHVRELLASLPHPKSTNTEDWYRRFDDQSLLDQVEWMRDNAGDKGRASTLKQLKALVADSCRGV